MKPSSAHFSNTSAGSLLNHNSCTSASSLHPRLLKTLYASVKVAIIVGQRACSANKSISVSSRALLSITPPFVAPIPRQIASATDHALPVPSCSTETKHGKPEPDSYRERTDVPIIRGATMTRSVVEGILRYL